MINADKEKRIKELVELLDKAAKAYYSEDAEIMSNFEYDALYDELAVLEEETGLILPDSPTQQVGYEAAKGLAKEAHEQPMLSLDKTKEPEALKAFLRDQKGLLSWKLDGLTVVLTYEDGRLQKAVTRGNGEIGEVVTANAGRFKNVPKSIPWPGKLVVRGEAIIKYSDFEKINEEIEDAEAKYKNPRNLCSGSVRQLDPRVTAKRNVYFYAFSLAGISENSTTAGAERPESAMNQSTAGAERSESAMNQAAAGAKRPESAMNQSAAGAEQKISVQINHDLDFNNSNVNKMEWLQSQGFDVVPWKVVSADTIDQAISEFEKEIQNFDLPSDGLVLLMDDIAYGESLGRTAKFPRNAIAFKWKDETAETRLLEIEWSPSRTGLINPIAIFEPVELEGTTVSRASLHNVSICRELALGIGDILTVYKANMIIPQIAENKTGSKTMEIPQNCPACGAGTVLRSDNGVETLHCPNPECPSKKIKSFTNFVSRNAMNIEGISEETLEKFIAHGFITDFTDIFRLERHRGEITKMYGFGEKSYNNIIASVNESRKTTAARLLNALGIPNIGAANSKVICAYFSNDFNRVMNAGREELLNIEGVGDIIADTFIAYFENEKNRLVVENLLGELEFEKASEEKTGEALKGLTFVITGSLNHYANRDALKSEIEAAGGKVSGSVSSKTAYLINNDINSTSGKNRDAKKLGIPIITEEEYISRFSDKTSDGQQERS